jgi:hypothetical protein
MPEVDVEKMDESEVEREKEQIREANDDAD